jgi:hypothetical protein
VAARAKKAYHNHEAEIVAADEQQPRIGDSGGLRRRR